MTGTAESVRLPRAIDANDDVFGRWAVEEMPPPFVRPLRCAGCTTTVSPVHGYVNRHGTQVDPLYRLAKGGAHDEGCAYDFEAQIGALHQRSVQVVERDGDVFILVLNSALDDEHADVREKVRQPRSKLHYVRRAGAPLRQTLRAAVEIVRLLQKFEDDPDAKKRFRAAYGGHLIEWDDFCFDAAHDLKRLYSLLGEAVSAMDHPRVVFGRIDYIRVDNDSKTAAYFAVRGPETSSRSRPVKAADGVPITPVLRASPPTKVTVSEGDLVLGYGRWVPFTPKSGRAHYATLWLDDHRGAVTPIPE